MKKIILFILACCLCHLGFAQINTNNNNNNNNNNNMIRSAILGQTSKTYTIATFDGYSDQPYQQISLLTVDAHGVDYNIEVNKTTSHQEIAAVRFRLKSFYDNNVNNDSNKGTETIIGDLTENLQTVYGNPRRPSGQYIGTHIFSLELANLNSTIPPGNYTAQINISAFEVNDASKKIHQSFDVHIQVREIVEVAVEKFTVEPFVFNTFERLENGINQDFFKVYLKTNKDSVSRLLNIHALFDEEVGNNLDNAVLGLRKKNSGPFHPVSKSSISIGLASSTHLSEHVFELGVKPQYYLPPGNYLSQICYTFTEP